MARIRTIKPEFFTSEDIVTMTPLARLFYVSLWCESDRAGRLEWKPGTFKIRYLPGDQCDIATLAKELTDRKLIVLYEVDGKTYAEIPSFERHQVINNREADSALPPRPHARTTRAPRVKAEGREGREGNGRKGTADADAFAEFWEAWPKNERKQDKAKCFDKFVAGGCVELIAVLLADIAVKKSSQKWQGGFIEAPEVYINNRRWEDGATTGFSIDAADAVAVEEWVTQRGVEAIAKRVGMPPWDQCRPFPDYRADVRKAAEGAHA